MTWTTYAVHLDRLHRNTVNAEKKMKIDGVADQNICASHSHKVALSYSVVEVTGNR